MMPGSGGDLKANGLRGMVMSLSVEEVARLLSAAGGRKVTAEQVQADLDTGAPALPGGRVNLVHYAAWLVREVQAK